MKEHILRDKRYDRIWLWPRERVGLCNMYEQIHQYTMSRWPPFFKILLEPYTSIFCYIIYLCCIYRANYPAVRVSEKHLGVNIRFLSNALCFVTREFHKIPPSTLYGEFQLIRGLKVASNVSENTAQLHYKNWSLMIREIICSSANHRNPTNTLCGRNIILFNTCT